MAKAFQITDPGFAAEPAMSPHLFGAADGLPMPKRPYECAAVLDGLGFAAQ